MQLNANYTIRPGTNYSPHSEIFRGMTKKQIKEFYQWFMTSLPYCIEELMQLVANTPGFEKWEADDSPDSLEGLGAWFAKQVEKRDYSLEEIEYIKQSNKSGIEIEITPWGLTEQTKSLALYVGMYYGCVAIKSNPALHWEQCLNNKKFADYGQPVLNGVGVVPINPVGVAHSIAFGIIDGTENGGALRKAYEFWANLRMKG